MLLVLPLLVAAPAMAADRSWQCQDVAIPADAVGWSGADGHGPAYVAWDDLAAFDTSACVYDVTCEDCYTGGREGFANCELADGSVVSWWHTWTWESDVCDTSNDEEVLTVAPGPALGLAWSTATVTRDDVGSGCGSCYGGTGTTTASWVGTLEAGWPSDAAFDASVSSSDCMGEGYSSASWADPTCSWTSVSDSYDDEFTQDTVTMGGHTVEVETYAGPTGYCYSDVLGPVAVLDDVTFGTVDALTWESTLGTDTDGDGWDAAMGDCDDSDAGVNPCMIEVPYDGVDQNCDGVDLNDADGDGYIAVEAGGDDCNDADIAVHPGAVETYADGIDQDCSGADWTDFDGDGHDGEGTGGPNPDDCDDYDAERFPGNPEVCGDGVDQDCTGEDRPCVDVHKPTVAPPAPAPEAGKQTTATGCGAGASAFLLFPLGLLRRRRRR